MRIVLGTRGSQLALTQSGHVADALRALGHDVELRTVKTSGDVIAGSLVHLGGTGVFAAALREALLAGEVDIAVHSYKDLPTAGVPGLVVAAVPPREDWRDALCSAGGVRLAALPEGARIGTGSPRRAAQLRALRPDVTVVEIRGNVPTRLARATGPEADLDAVVLAAAGLRRLDLGGAITELLEDLLPAPAQGALAVECRTDAAGLRDALAALDDPPTRDAARAERAVLAELGAGCAAPVAALATDGVLTARVFNAEGTDRREVVVRLADHPDAEAAGRAAAQELLATGAADVTPLGAARPSQLAEFHDDRALWATGTALVGRRLLLPRRDGGLAEGLRGSGADVDCHPLTRTVPLPAGEMPSADWLVFTSPTGVRLWLESGRSSSAVRVAAVGAATRGALVSAGVAVELTPTGGASAAALVDVFPDGPGSVLVPGSALSAPTLADGLRAKGWSVRPVPLYTTESVAQAPAELAEAWGRGDYDAVVITAGSVARAVVDLLGRPPARTAVVAFGEPSAEAARGVGLDVAAVADTPDAPGVVAAVQRALAAAPEPAPVTGEPFDPPDKESLA